MKILAQYSRKSMEAFFGKRGFSLLGVMIVFGSESKFKDVEYHFYLTEDTTQDANNVLAVKQDLYNKLSSRGINKIHFRSDGAKCFSQKLMKTMLPLWKFYANVEVHICGWMREESTRRVRCCLHTFSYCLFGVDTHFSVFIDFLGFSCILLWRL